MGDEERRDKNPPKDPSGEIPKTLPILPMKIESYVVFPSVIPINLYYTIFGEFARHMLAAVEREKYAVVVPLTGETLSTVGVLCEVVRISYFEENGQKMSRVSLLSLRRVFCSKPKVAMGSEPNNTNNFVVEWSDDWSDKHEEKISKERYQDIEFRQKLSPFLDSFLELYDFVCEMAGEEGRGYFDAAAELARNHSAENIATLVDAVMVALQTLPLDNFDMGTPSYIIFKEKNVENRMLKTWEFAETLLVFLYFNPDEHNTDSQIIPASSKIRRSAEEEKSKKIKIDGGEYRKRYEKIKSRIPEEARNEIERELARFERGSVSGEAEKAGAHLEWLLGMPWGVYTEDTADLSEVRRILDRDHSGLSKAKERILEAIAVRQLNPSAKSPILCFVGPPGVGKTSLGRSIADAMGRKFIRLSLGGLRDEAAIRGHTTTYVGSMPGQIIQLIKNCRSANPVFMLDEVEKLGKGWISGDPSAILLEILDPEQNNAFRDLFLNTPFDLSRVFFIATANEVRTIYPALEDRMEIMEFPGYTPFEKLDIAKTHLIPRKRTDCGFPVILDGETFDVEFIDEAVFEIISNYTREAGVRGLEKRIDSIFRKAALAVKSLGAKSNVFTEGILEITKSNLLEHCGLPKFKPFEIPGFLKPGVAPMVAVGDYGGYIFYVECGIKRGEAQRKIKVTGVRGSKEARQAMNNLIEESADVALDSLILDGCILKVDEEKKKGEFYIHISVKNGAQPKDGPSAGVPLHWALYAILTNQNLAPDIIATGEIDLVSGKIGAIGGLRMKAIAAHRHGFKKFVIPAENQAEIADIPKEVRDEMEILPLDSMWDALAVAFPNDDKIKRFIES